MDFTEHEDHEEEIGMAVPLGYESVGNSSAGLWKRGHASGGEGAVSEAPRKVGSIRYCECLKNHAVSTGGHAVDGCGEFMAAGDEGTLDALRCAACNCHRNFHRKETDVEGNIYNPHHLQDHPQLSPYYKAPPPAGYLHLTSPPQHRPASGGGGGIAGAYSKDDGDVSNPSTSGREGGGSGGFKKRFRTKFTAQQKHKMLAFAERLGWRIQKHDEAAVEQFCEETGVKRHVLKVWMHNHKQTLGQKP